MRRIVHLTSVHRPFDVRIFHKECRSLAEAGFDVHLVAPHERDEVKDGVSVWAVRRAKTRPQRMTALAWSVYRRALKLSADLYHFHDPELIPWGLALRARGKHVVYDSHEYLAADVATKAWLLPAVAKRLAVAVDILEEFAARRLSGVVAVNPHMAARFQRLNPCVAVVANYPHRKTAEMENDGSSQRPRTAFYSGPIDADRGIRTLVMAQRLARRSVPDAVVSILGEVDTAAMDGISMADLTNDGVALLPRVPYEDVPEILRRHAVGWVPWTAAPAYLYGTPTKLLEYMAAGLPVVVSDLPFVKRIVEESDCGIVVPWNSPEAHATALVELWQSPEKARTKGQNGRRAVLERLNWETQVPALLDLYKRVFERKN